MDICNRFEVNGQNTLYVTGIGPEYTDEEITAVFKVNGDISKLVRIPDELGQPEGRALIQYASDRSISRIDPITLGTVPSPKDPAVLWFARTIREVCQEAVGREIARRYLGELKSVAGSGRKGFLSVLQEELQGNQSTSHDVHSNVTQPSAAQNANTPNNDQNEPAEPTHAHSASASLPTSPVHISKDIFNPPQIQKVIVEHVIRSESTTSPSPQIRLRTFSGRMPRPNGEVDYETWRTQVDLLLNEPSLNDAHKVRRILESLLSPAADVVKPLGISSPPSVYISQLDSAFGVVKDGEELFAAFLGSNQDIGEKPSAYLNRLHSILTRAISRGGASAENSNDLLLRQFCRGCWDQSIIIGLQLECKKGNPPTFPEFLLMLRTEEDRRSTKLDRMKKHLGASKANMYAHHVFDMPSYDCEPVPLPNTKSNETSKLEKKCESIMDTGSQVTTVSECFHKNHLSHLPIHPIHALLEIEGAGGQQVPYLGYIEARVTFPLSVPGREEELVVLALVVPECQFNSRTPLLIGTNVLLRLYEQVLERDGPEVVCKLFSRDSAVIFQRIAQIHDLNNHAHPVRLHGGNPITIPAKQKCCITGDVRLKKNSQTTFVLEPNEHHRLPGGVFLEAALMDIPFKSSCKVPVVLRNLGDHDVTLQPKCIIAQICAAQQVTSLGPVEEVFAVDDLSYGHTTAVKHHIRLHDETPFKERPRPIHPSDREAVKQHLKELLDAGIIKESQSPFASPVVLVRKKNGSIRLCIDYRKLNARTIRDAYALPNIEETFAALSGAKWFSVMDLKSGYYQVEMAEEDKPKTAFTCPLGFFEFNRMPQGVTNAPSTFQRLMERCVGDLHLNEVLVFLDDLIVFSDTLEQHEARLMKVLNRLKDFGLKLSPEKCHFFKASVKYLGHVVDARGVHTDPDKISALREWPRPSNRKELKCFLGFAGYYRRFVEGYSQIAKPLNSLTAGYYPPKKRGKVYKRERFTPLVSPNAPLGEEWTSECENAFRTLIKKLTSAPILAFANPQLPYVVHTDACRDGLGAALYQEQEGKLRVVAYASRDAAGHRWLAALSTYQFTIKYRAGQANRDADGLSRRPQGPPLEDEAFTKERERIEDMKKRFMEAGDDMDHEVFSALCQRHLVMLKDERHPHSEQPVIAESLVVDPSVVPDVFGEDTLPSMANSDWCNAQNNDPSLSRVITFVRRAVKPSFRETNLEHPDVKLLLREWKKLELRDGVLYRKWSERGELVYQLVLPEQFRERALQGVHDDVGHLGSERALQLARARFYWPRMARDIEDKCKKCERCFRRKAVPQRAAPLENISAAYPLELLCMDYLSLEPDDRDTRNILVITDHFTKFAVAVPTKDQKARTVAKALWENFIVHYGFPSRLLSNQGRDFESKTIRELCTLIGADKVRTTPGETQWNGLTGPSLPRLPVDLVLGIQPDMASHKTHSEYVKGLRQRLQESYSLAAKNAKKMGEKNKARFDREVRAAELLEGDRVLVRNMNIRGKHKLADRWEQKIHVVVRRISNSPVYVVKPETGEGPHRTLHRDLLLPCGFLPVTEVREQSSSTDASRKMRLRGKSTKGAQGDTDCQEDESYSNEDELYPNTWVPEIITKSPFLQREGGSNEPQPVSRELNPDTPSFVPQSSAHLPERPTHELQPGTPLVSSENSGSVTHPTSHCRTPDHIVIDIPEPDMTQISPVGENTDLITTDPVAADTDNVVSESQESENTSVRRSAREKRPPRKLTYDELGEPLTLAISSFFQALGAAISHVSVPVGAGMHAGTHAV
ncbi:unnamed protein product [Oreochromis niloticus]|nr:unnamed protein product [Mustela putorius furo]